MPVQLLFIGQSRISVMLPKPQNDLFHLLSILESIGKIDHYLIDVNSAEEFIEKEDQLYFNATLTLLVNIGETFGKISEESQKYIDKDDLDGMRRIRNRIAHDYPGIDSFRIYEIIKTKLSKLKNQVEQIIRKYLNNKIIDIEEFNISKESKFYKHIDFNNLG